MDSEKSTLSLFKKEKPPRLLSFANIHITLNIISRCLNAITCFYLTWYCFKVGILSNVSVHAWTSAIGYQILMIEGILVLYKNTGTVMVDGKDKKVTIHWIFLGAGSFLGIFGSVYYYIWREIGNRKHFANRHGMWGKIAANNKNVRSKVQKCPFRLSFNYLVATNDYFRSCSPFFARAEKILEAFAV